MTHGALHVDPPIEPSLAHPRARFDGPVAAVAGTSPIMATLEAIHAELAARPIDGDVADYIPELARANPADFGIVLATADGQTYAVGDVDTSFTIQSISKAFVYGLVLEACGMEATLQTVGVEPSGEAFNSISLYPETGRPFNPMINAGAIASTGLLHGLHGPRTIDIIRERFGTLAGRALTIDEAVFESERATGHRNRAIAHLLRNFGKLGADVDGVLDAYFAQCAVQVTCRDLAMMGACLANHGQNPSTGKRALAAEHVHRVLSVMSSCGVYDFSGEWAYRVGLPAKSGVGGGMLAVLPGQLAIAVFAPPLDERGNSVRGVRVCEELARHFQLHLLHTPLVSAGAIHKDRSGLEVRSRRKRRPRREALLDEYGMKIRFLQVQGELSFSAIELISRHLSQGLANIHYLVLDLHRVAALDETAVQLLLALQASFEEHGKTLLFSRCRQLEALILALHASGREDTTVVDDASEALERCEEALLAEFGSDTGFGEEVAFPDQQLLRGLTRSEISALERHLIRQLYAGGEVIARAGEPASRLYFVGQGQVAVEHIGAHGERSVVAEIPAGLSFGEMALIEREPRNLTVRASSATLCLELPLAALESPQMLEVRYKLLRNVAANLARRLSSAQAELQSFV